MAPRRAPWVPPLLGLLVILLVVHTRGEVGEREDRRFLFNIFNRRPVPVDREERSCSCTCGERNDATRIVGGKPAGTNEFPWIVRLSYFNRFYCGGMLINDRYVLTAAHCVKGFMWFMIKVTFGEHDRCDKSFKPESRFVLRAITGDFSYLNFDNDIAILRLNDRVPMTETIRPICLPKDTEDSYVGARAIASGWGTLKEDGKPACILQEVEVPVMSNRDCKKTNYSEKIISENMLCAGYPEGLKDSCQGDSGGPLIREKEDKRYELIGVVSWGNGCARPGFPGIYTRVTRYLDWIRNNTAGGCWCEEPPKAPGTSGDKEGTTQSTSTTGEAQGAKPEETTTTETSKETTAKPVEDTSDKEKPAQAMTEKPVEDTSDKDKPVQTMTAKPEEHTSDKEKPVQVTTAKPVEDTSDKDKPVQTMTAKPEEHTSDKEKPVQVTTAKPVQDTSDKEKPVEAVTENQQDQTTQKQEVQTTSDQKPQEESSTSSSEKDGKKTTR